MGIFLIKNKGCWKKPNNSHFFSQMLYYDPIILIIIYNYFIGKLGEFYFTMGSQDQFCLQKHPERIYREVKEIFLYQGFPRPILSTKTS